jgi:hypothetical protein
VGFSRRDRVRPDQPLDGDGLVAVVVGAVAELSGVVGAPRLDRAVAQQREAEHAAGRNRGHAAEFFDFDRRQLVRA